MRHPVINIYKMKKLACISQSMSNFQFYFFILEDDTEADLAVDEEEEEIYDDYDLNHDELESNLLAMSNSLRIAANDDDFHMEDNDPIGINDVPDGDDDDASSSGDCFGSTGLFTAM